MSSNQWTCRCNYMNAGPICTKCGELRPLKSGNDLRNGFRPLQQPRGQIMTDRETKRTERPTEPGWYWYQWMPNHPASEPHCVELKKQGDSLTVASPRLDWDFQAMSGEWRGPIHPDDLRKMEIMEMNLCPHAVRYGRTCDDGLTDEEIEEFLKPPTESGE